jgi:hypothetical protein
VSRNSDESLSVGSVHYIELSALVRNIIPRLLVFLMKDNFSDFSGLKIAVPAREEAVKLLAHIQYLSDLPEKEGGLDQTVK